jgi:hypothetical protein
MTNPTESAPGGTCSLKLSPYQRLMLPCRLCSPQFWLLRSLPLGAP